MEARPSYEKQPGDPKFQLLMKESGQIVREEIATLQRLVEEFSSFAKLPEEARRRIAADLQAAGKRAERPLSELSDAEASAAPP